MTKQSAEVFLEYIKELARDANMKVPAPNNIDFMTYKFEVVIEHGKIFEIRISGSEGKIRPK